ncbi:class I SAM-dependent methyltransferase [Butyrivibrio sp. XB500-5]|uniref:class I SAM-dependent methyltransferase n=1 Tax=Butyrivibrio sp. XB500-5 TaxID=2364880 RepID=UPI000EAA1D2A|nr:class I SAM-dependent methyltransferase [Butyrivibrio sp. XB500-5]RKM59488.1 class I SAM-dependent methyltransferase [Butyrivibrio sp. XB500-5]
MQEQIKIGSVTLNFKHYSGVDLYSDGAIENDLLEIVKNHTKDEYQKIIEERASWPILYHLSDQRANIVEWIPMSKDAKVLEVGSGCGAITGMLSSKAGQVVSCDLSRRRSEINATRNKDCDNVTIHVGNFRDIEPDLDKDFDFIFLIGVFEYGQGYIGTENPYEKFLLMLKRHLKKDGRIVIAIENRLGLKYFAGCTEDHLGTYFSGIEGYTADSVAKTFTRGGLINIFKRCRINDYHFYYPYPDYKLMTLLHSDSYLPKFGELQDNVRNFDRDRLVLFNEKHAYEDLVKDGLYPEFANSFEVIIGPGFDTIYSKYSNDRVDEFKIRTDIAIGRNGRKVIKKFPLTEAAREHVYSIRDAYAGLKEKYHGGDLEINDCQIDENEGCAVFSFVNGVPLASVLDECIDKDDMEGFNALISEYIKRIRYKEDYPVSDYDLIFSNIMVNGPIWTIIDYEWTYGKCIPAKEQVWRALYCYRLEDRKREKFDPKPIFKKLGLSDKEMKVLLEEEYAFQKYVTGNRKSMVEIWKDIGRKVIVPKELAMNPEAARAADCIQIYMDEGTGYSEDDSFFPEEQYDEKNIVTLNIEVPSSCKTLRVDPAFSPCLVTILDATWNDDSIEDGTADISVNPGNGEWLSDDSFVFNSDDPNIEFDLTSSRLSVKENNMLVIKLLTTLVPKNAADAVAASVKSNEDNDKEKISIIRKIGRKIKNKRKERREDADYDELDDYLDEE